jgi:hypothetical protein
MKYLKWFLIIAFIAGSKIGTTQSPQATISTPEGSQLREPGLYQLADLFRHADRVALVKVISGTTEAYEVAIYKAQVVEGFKGLSAGEIVYFGPYIATEIGTEYILFLRDNPKAIEPRAKAEGGYGTVHYWEVFDEGYSSMRISYECVFGGSSKECDYGVRVCTDYIKLPKSLPAFPNDGDDPPFGCRWVRKNSFISVLEEIGEKKK